MISENQHYSRQDLLAALEQGWHQYLSRLHEVSEKEQILYAQAQGFARVEDVLVHIVAWWERSMQRSFMILNGHQVPRSDVDAFNTEVVESYQQWTREAIEETFATVLTTFERFLKELPETAFENERIQLWLRIDAVDHYEDHRLPNAPRLLRA